MGGLASGMDIDALVEKLMKAERVPLDKTFQKKQTYEWQRDAYRSVNTKVSTFSDFLFNKMILSGKMNQKTATSSNEDLVGVKATSGASGNISIGGVSQLASSAQTVGEQTSASGNTKLSELGITDTSIELKAIDAKGRMAEKATTITFDPNTETVDQFVKKINDSGAGVTAIFEGGKLSLSAKNTGSEKTGQGEIVATSGIDVFDKLGFTGTDGKLASNGKNAMFEVNGIQTERSSNTFTISGYEMTLKKTFNEGNISANQLQSAQKEADNAAINLTNKQTAFNNAKSHYERDDFEGNFNTAYNSAFKKANLNPEQEALYKGIKNKDGLSKLTDEQLTAISEKTLEELKEDEDFKGFKEEDLKILKDNDSNLEQLRSRAQDDANEKLYESANKDLLVNDEVMEFFNNLDSDDRNLPAIRKAIDDLPDGTLKQNLIKSSELDLEFLAENIDELNDFVPVAKAELTFKEEKALYDAADKDMKAAVQRDLDAKQSLKNAQEVNNSVGGNSTITTTAVTMKASSDTQAAKEQIMEFVEKYNEIVDEFNKQLKETKYRDYPALTSEQRKDMSEHEQKIWDEKAKSGLLRNDQILREGMSNMRSTFLNPVDGLNDELINSLSKIGITTSKDLKDNGKLVIDDKKLDEALAKDPDQVHKLFAQDGEVKRDASGKVIEDTRGIAWRLRDSMKDMTTQIEKKAGKDGGVNNTFSLGKKIVEADDRIKTLQAKLKDIEARYWKQFTAMEKAIQKANEQAGMFAQFGQ